MDQRKLKIAYHEVGHAIMALICRQPIRSVSIKEMNSPLGTEKYLGSTILEPFEQKQTLTINELTRRVMISLGGFASEILLFDGVTGMGGDDLTAAVKWTDLMMQSEQFRNLAASMPVPEPSPLDTLIANPLVRAFIDYQIHVCVARLRPLRPAIQLIGRRLYESDELTGDQVVELFDSFVRSKQPG
ncbi:MAG: hypothetical protein KF681_15880 [Bdellovibrionaceae bacterium]|nr:hypothetical protein [Pseudobdellovibrionaceae bacterium]